MALAHEPDVTGFVDEPERLLVPRWSEEAPSRVTKIRPATRSIFDMPINPLPAPALDEVFAKQAVDPSVVSHLRSPAIVVPLFARATADEDGPPIDYRPLWVAGAFLAASLCAAVTVAPSWFQVAPTDATSITQRLATQLTGLIGVTGIAVLAAVLSTALLLVGAQRVDRS